MTITTNLCFNLCSKLLLCSDICAKQCYFFENPQTNKLKIVPFNILQVRFKSYHKLLVRVLDI